MKNEYSKRKEKRFSQQAINEGTILSDDYLVFGDKELWPEMKWGYAFGLSPKQLVWFLSLGVPVSLLFFYYGPIWPFVVLGIWWLCSRRLSRLDWALALRSGHWLECEFLDKKYVENCGFLMNRATAVVYNKREMPFVLEYRKTHPGWWRRDPLKGKMSYNDGLHFHRYTKKDLSWEIEGFWVTMEEYDAINKRADDLYKNDNGVLFSKCKTIKYWGSDEHKALNEYINKYCKSGFCCYNRDYSGYKTIALMEFYRDHRSEIEDAKSI